MKPLRKYQRGNIVVGVGLPPTQIVDPAGNFFPSGDPSPGGAWTVADDWSVAQGGLVAIEAAFQARGGRPRSGTLFFSPDGTKLTLSSTSSDNTLVFLLGTAFDPNTASLLYDLPFSNPGQGQYNSGGTRYVQIGTTDTFRMYSASEFVINSPTVLSDVSKTEVGFTSSTDGPAMWGPNLDYNLWLGGQPSDAIKNVSFPAGDLDAFVVESTIFNGLVDPNGQPLSNCDKTETMCYQGAGAQGVYIVSFDAPRDTASFLRSAVYDLRNNVPASFDFRPGSFWFDPNDTTYVWGIADPTGNLQIVKYATHVPSF